MILQTSFSLPLGEMAARAKCWIYRSIRIEERAASCTLWTFVLIRHRNWSRSVKNIRFLPEISTSINIVRIIIMLRSTSQYKITFISQNSDFLWEWFQSASYNHALDLVELTTQWIDWRFSRIALVIGNNDMHPKWPQQWLSYKQ